MANFTAFSSKITASALALAAASAFLPAAAQAEEANSEQSGNEIIVTATKRNDTIQRIPFSINAQTASDMQRTGAGNIEDVSRSVAGLTVQNFGPGQSQVSIRGVSAGQIARDQPGVKEQVGVYFDETVVSLSLFTPDFDLFDLNRVETLRGPQGTLFGSGSEGGTVRYITNQPKLGKLEGSVEAGVNVLDGGDIGYSAKGAINLPLGEKAALRVVGYGEHFGGFINAIGPSAGKNINDGRRYGGRVSLLLQPTDEIRITPRIIYQDIQTNGFNREDVYNLYYNKLISPTQIIPERTQYLKFREGFRDKTTLADLNIGIDLSDNVTLTSVTSYVNRDVMVSRDASALTGSVYISPFAGAAPGASGGANLNSNLVDPTKLKQFTQELRLASTGTGPLQWVLGGFYSHVDRKYAQRLPTPGSDAFGQLFLNVVAGGLPISATYNGFPANSPYNADIPYIIKQTAVFGEASYQAGSFKLTAGGRYYDFSEASDFKTGGIFANGDNQVGRKTSSNGFTPRVIASYEATQGVTLNLQASKGFRLGGVNDNLLQNLCTAGDLATYGNRPKFGDESLWNYEGGIKAHSGGLTFNASVFHSAIKNLQVTADAGSCSTRVIFNVPKAHSTGIEMEFSAKPAPGLELSLSGSYTDSKFDSTVLDSGGGVIAGIRKGNRLPTVPKFQMAAAATYTAKLASVDWATTASFQHVGDRFTQAVDQEPGVGTFTNSIYYNPANGTYGTGAYTFGAYNLPSYNLVNLSTGLSWENGLSISVFVNNLFNKTPLLALDRERGGRARLGYSIGSPRKIGLTVRKDF